VLSLLLLLAAAPGSPPDAGTLESLLERARTERAAAEAALAPRVDDLAARLLEIGPKGPRADLKEVRLELASLDPAAAPLLVPRLDPGAEPTAASLFVAREVARALAPIAHAGATPGLLALLRTDRTEARANALRVLGASSDTALASRALTRAFRGEETALLRAGALEGLARQGGSANLDVVAEALRSGDEALEALALDAFAGARAAGQADAVRAYLLEHPDAAAARLGGLVAYWSAVPEALDRDTQRAALALVSSGAPLRSDLLLFLDALPDIRDARPDDVRDPLEPLVKGSDRELREEALMCLARLGDRKARRELLRARDEVLNENKGWYKAWRERGDVLLRIGDADRAARDYRKALELMGDARERDEARREILVELARCHVLEGRLRQASEELERAELPAAAREALAADPDFAPLVEHARHGRVLR
jgi:tetratricopeptide (TPR) repeat protein